MLYNHKYILKKKKSEAQKLAFSNLTSELSYSTLLGRMRLGCECRSEGVHGLWNFRFCWTTCAHCSLSKASAPDLPERQCTQVSILQDTCIQRVWESQWLFFFLMACKEILLKIKEKLLHLITATTEREAPCVGGLFKFVETIYQLSQPQCPVFITHIMCHST